MEKPLASTYPRVAFWTLLLVVSGLGVAIVLPFLAPLLWAGALAILSWPIHRRVLERVRRPDPAAFVTLILTLVLVLIPLIAVGAIVTAQLSQATRSLQGDGLQQALRGLESSIAPYARRLGVEDLDLATTIQTNRAPILAFVERGLAQAAAGLGTTLFNLIIALFALYFFLRDGAKWRDTVVRLSGLEERTAVGIMHKVADTVRGVFVGTIAVAILQGVIIGLTAALLGIPNALLLGVLTVVMGFVPILGAPAVYGPAAIILFATGKPGAGLVLLLVGGLLVSQVDNILRPIFVGSQVNLHSLAVFLFILGGVAVFGPVGILAGPTALALLIGMRDLLLAHLDGRSLVEEAHEGV